MLKWHAFITCVCKQDFIILGANYCYIAWYRQKLSYKMSHLAVKFGRGHFLSNTFKEQSSLQLRGGKRSTSLSSGDTLLLVLASCSAGKFERGAESNGSRLEWES